MARPLVERTDRGLYCAAGDFYVDPWQPVDRAVITHAHGDHLRPGSKSYLCSREGMPLVEMRMGEGASVEAVPYGRTVRLGDTTVSLHPAGHIPGSAQVRIEHRGEVWVVSGDYKTAPDPTCAPFELVPCDVFITECTFGLPIYRWRPEEDVLRELHDWWRANAADGRASVVFAYAVGKAQRVLARLDPEVGPILTHGAVERVAGVYRRMGVALPATEHVDPGRGRRNDGYGGALVLAPPMANGTPWMRRFGDASTAFVSGWMRIRGTRRRRSVDRGFVISDHVDWTALTETIAATGAGRVVATHGYTDVVARWCRERGLEADVYPTYWEGERDDTPDDADEEGAE